MPQISRRTLSSKTKTDITEQFINTIAGLEKPSAQIFFNRFFTKTERLMFAKRLAIIYLLREGFSAYRIAQLLKVSQTTVHGLDVMHSAAGKNAVIAACEKFSANDGLLKELKDLFLNGFSMNPKRRAKWLNDFEKRYE